MSGLRLFSRSESSFASEPRVQPPASRAPFSYAGVSGRNYRVPILMRHALRLTATRVNCVWMKGPAWSPCRKESGMDKRLTQSCSARYRRAYESARNVQETLR